MITDTSIDTPCSPEVEHLVTTVSVTSETSNSNVDDSQSDWHSDPDSCAPEVMVPDARVFSSVMNEQKYPWLYDRVVHQGYLCNCCELFCGHTSSSQECVTVGVNLGLSTV